MSELFKAIGYLLVTLLHVFFAFFYVDLHINPPTQGGLGLWNMGMAVFSAALGYLRATQFWAHLKKWRNLQ